jgi:WD40 repeat protein/serine/threonine protein kinase
MDLFHRGAEGWAMPSLLEHTKEFHVIPFPTIPGYEILEELGRGGMGVVYKARQQRPERLVAVKVLLPELAGLPEKMARFRAEANAVARLQHPNIVQIFEVGEVGGLPFFSLELVEGGILADQLGQPWPISQAVAFVEKLARAIHYAHERGIVHRDLKPANILLSDECRVMSDESRNKSPVSHSSLVTHHLALVPKITDFGLAKLLDEEPHNGDQVWQTQIGVVLGTPPYMAPEQAAGRTREIGPATDIHALGMILYEMLTGQPPFRAGSVLETLEQIKAQKPLPPSQLLAKKDAKLDAPCLRCLEKDPRRRYANAAALADDLNRYRSSQAGKAGATSTPIKTQTRRPTVVALQTILAIISTVGSGLTVWQVFQAEHGKQAAEAALSQNDEEAALVAPLSGALGGDPAKPVLPHQSPTTAHHAPAALLAFERAMAGFDQGDASQGMHWLARSLQETPSEDQPLQHLIRANLAYWRTQLNALQYSFSHRGPVEIVGFSADGNRAFTICRVRSSAADQHMELRVWDLLRGKPASDPIVQKEPITCAVLSPDGRMIIVAGADGLARLWDVNGNRPISQPLRHEGAITAVAFSPNGQRVLTASADGTARLWNAQTGQPAGSPLKHLGAVTALAFSADGALVATAGADHSVRLWDASTGLPAHSQSGVWERGDVKHDGPVTALAFSPNGRMLLSGSDDRSARLWDATTGRPIGGPLPHKDRVLAVTFSPDGMFLVTGSADRTARLWETATGKPIGSPLQHVSAVNNVQVSADGYKLFATSSDFSAQLWDLSPASSWIRPHRLEAGSAESAKSLLLSRLEKVTTAVLSPDGRRVLTGSLDGTAKLWEIADGMMRYPALQHRGRISAVSFSPDGQNVLTASWDWTARLWDAKTGKPIGSPIQHNSTICSAAFSRDGTKIITGAGSLDKTARIWNARTGGLACPPLQHPSGVVAVAFTPNGNMAVTVGADHAVRLWNAHNGQPLWPPFLHPGEIQAFAISPDNRSILTGCSDSAARLWDVGTGALMRQPIWHPGPVLSVAFSPDGQRFLTGCQDGKARLWSTTTCTQLAELPLNREVAVVTFSSDGRWILTASRASEVSKGPGVAQLWEATTGQPHGPALHHSASITEALFSPDNSLVFIGDASGTGRLWDVAIGKPIGPVLRNPASISVAAFAPDGRSLATGDMDGMVRLWKLPELMSDDVGKIVSWVEQITGR